MITVLMQFAVALAPVFAGWAVVASIAAIKTARTDLITSAWRGLVAATLCAALATGGLVAALVTGDLSVRFVTQTSSVLMPARYVASALLSAPGGALLALAAIVGGVGLIVAAASRDAARQWTIATLGGALFVPLTCWRDQTAAICRAITDYRPAFRYAATCACRLFRIPARRSGR